MSEPEVLVVARTFWERIGARDLDGALSLLDEDGVWWTCAARHRRDQPFREMAVLLRRLLTAVPVTMTVHSALVDGNRVALEMEGHGHAGEQEYNNCYCFVMTVAGGRITSVREYVDTMYADEVLLSHVRRVSTGGDRPPPPAGQ